MSRISRWLRRIGVALFLAAICPTMSHSQEPAKQKEQNMDTKVHRAEWMADGTSDFLIRAGIWGDFWEMGLALF